MRSYTPQTISLPARKPASRSLSSVERLPIQESRRVKCSRPPQAVTSRSLSEMHLDAGPSEFISMMGPSGHDKTLLLRLLTGLDRPLGGKGHRYGEAARLFSAEKLAILRRRNLGCVLPDFPLLEQLTLAENVALPLSLEGQGARELLPRAREVLRFLDMAELDMDCYPQEVSALQRQRAALARAIVQKPLLVFADQPADDLDPQAARTLLELYQRLNTQLQMTVLLVTHDPFSASYSQRVIFLRDESVVGHVKRSGSQEDFFQAILDTIMDLEKAGTSVMAETWE